MKFSSIALLCIVLVIQIHICTGIQIENFFEQKCSRAEGGFITQNYENWSLNITGPMYFPMIAKMDLLRLTQDLFQKADLGFLSGQDVLNSCITVIPSQSPVFRLTFSGYCDRTFSKVLTPVVPKVVSWNKLFPDGLGGSFRISLSDNKSWQIMEVCWDDGQRSWVVLSANPRLPPCAHQVIIEHLKAIGFSEKYFTGLQYEYCNGNCFARPAQPRATGGISGGGRRPPRPGHQ